MATSLYEQFRKARVTGVPIISIDTHDPEATIKLLSGDITNTTVTRVIWDIVNGVRALGDHSKKSVTGAISGQTGINADNMGKLTMSAVSALKFATDTLPPSSVMFMNNVHRIIEEREVAQAIWNVRDAFKSTNRTLVLLSPGFRVPSSLEGDILTLTDPLPTDAQLREIMESTLQSAEIAVTDHVKDRTVEALHGLSSFAAEQTLAMSLSPSGVDLDGLWERKCKVIEQTPGLKINRDNPPVESLRGLNRIIEFARGLFQGPERPSLVVRIDEIEKMMAGVDGDNTGVSQEILGIILRTMEDNGWRGLIAMGPPGTGKSAVSKAMGSIGEVNTIELDLGALKASHVGESEKNARQAFDVIEALGGRNVFFVATCNDIAKLKPELIRRFPFGRWFFDIPTREDQSVIWATYLRTYHVYDDQNLADAWGKEMTLDGPDMTGAEIKSACELCYRLGCSPKEAVTYLIPYSEAEADALRSLRSFADGRFLSATHPGKYTLAQGSLSDNSFGLSSGRVFGNEETEV